jgi:hypothetical protein
MCFKILFLFLLFLKSFFVCYGIYIYCFGIFLIINYVHFIILFCLNVCKLVGEVVCTRFNILYICTNCILNGSAKIWWSLRRRFKSHRGTWEPVFRMTLYKPRSCYAEGVTRNRTAKSHKYLVYVKICSPVIDNCDSCQITDKLLLRLKTNIETNSFRNWVFF